MKDNLRGLAILGLLAREARKLEAERTQALAALSKAGGVPLATGECIGPLRVRLSAEAANYAHFTSMKTMLERIINALNTLGDGT